MSRVLETFSKVNLGCGPDWREDHWNVDVATTFIVDENVDVFGTLPWPSESFQEILASDILEHTSWMHTERVLTEWLRVLSPGGKIFIRVPDLHHLCTKYLADDAIDARRASYWIYGGHEDYVGIEQWHLNAHYVGFDSPRLFELCKTFELEIEKLENEDTNPDNLILIAKKR